MRVLAALVALILASPGPVQAADEGGWQGWAFEARAADRPGWFFGTWTAGACEEFRRVAIVERPDAIVGACLPVTLTDEPGGVAVWVVITSEYDFVASPTSDICEDDPTPNLALRPVALDYSFCRRVWIRVAV